jgi:hypothetical protein
VSPIKVLILVDRPRSVLVECLRRRSKRAELQSAVRPCRVHTSRYGGESCSFPAALLVPVATSQAPHESVVASLLIVVVCFSRGPCEKSRALPTPTIGSALRQGVAFAPRLTHEVATPCAQHSGRCLGLLPKLFHVTELWQCTALYLCVIRHRNHYRKWTDQDLMQSKLHVDHGHTSPAPPNDS